MSIALSVIDIATAALPQDQPGCQVESIHLEIGRLTAVVPDSLRRCFDIASRDTPLAGARLDIEEIAVVTVCRSCRAESEQDGFPFVCDSCRGTSLDLLCGRELVVTSIEVADP